MRDLKKEWSKSAEAELVTLLAPSMSGILKTLGPTFSIMQHVSVLHETLAFQNPLPQIVTQAFCRKKGVSSLSQNNPDDITDPR